MELKPRGVVEDEEQQQLICYDGGEISATSVPNETNGISSHHAAKGSIGRLFKSKYLILTSILASTGGILFGYDIGVISGALIQLTSLLNLTCFEQEMVTSSVVIGAFLMSLFGGILVDLYGRKYMIIVSAVLYALGAIVTLLAFSYPLLIFGRVVLGVAISLSSSSECVYVSEISPARFRGALVSFNEFGITLGFLLAYCSNAIFAFDEQNGWRWMFGSSLIIAFVMFVVVLPLPKSPRFLLMKGHVEKAKSALCQLRQRNLSSASVHEEWVSMKNRVLESTTTNIWTALRKSSSWYSLFIAFSLMIIQQMTGQPTLLFYASTVLASFGFPEGSTAALCSIGLGIAKLISTIVCICIIEKFNRKYFLIFGSVAMSASLLVISGGAISHGIGAIHSCSSVPEITHLNMSYQDVKLNVSTASSEILIDVMPKNHVIKWIILLSLVVFVSAYAFSFGPVSWLFLSELFPANIRGQAVSLSISLNWLFQLIVTLTFLSFSEACGSIGWPYLLNALFTLSSVGFMYKFLPETKGKSLEDVQADIVSQANNFCCKVST